MTGVADAAGPKAAGRVQTVLGLVEPGSLGLTHTHEHLLIDMRCYHRVPEEATRRQWVNAPLTMDRLGFISGNQNFSLDEATLLDESAAVSELRKFYLAGGGTIVDTTSVGIARDPLALARISRATRVNVVMGSGYYVPISHPADMDERSEESIYDEIVRDITVGVGDTGVKSGLIGELGNTHPLGNNEIKGLRAGAAAQQATGAPVLIHPGFHPDALQQIMQVLTGAGADPGRVIMGHLDHIGDRPAILELAASGCYLEWDTFGYEDTALEDVLNCPVPNDEQRLDSLEWLAEAGYLDRLLVGHDVCTQSRHSTHGGKTFDHFITVLVPRMRARGWSESAINTVLISNPARILTLQEPG
jgi:phosphotriesterase-related protein